MIKVTYQKANGETFYRIRNTLISYRVGDTTSIGWKVLRIEYCYNKKYYSKEEYDNLLNKRMKKDKWVVQLKKTLYTIYKQFVYGMIFLLTLRVFWALSTNVL